MSTGCAESEGVASDLCTPVDLAGEHRGDTLSPSGRARRRHARKSAALVKANHFTRTGDSNWVIPGSVTAKESSWHTVNLYRARSLPIRPHVNVRSKANPYDPAWELYFEEGWATQMASVLTGRGTACFF
jgi:hypothetical protein